MKTKLLSMYLIFRLGNRCSFWKQLHSWMKVMGWLPPSQIPACPFLLKLDVDQYFLISLFKWNGFTKGFYLNGSVLWTHNLDIPPLLRDITTHHYSTRLDLELLKCSQCLVKLQVNSILVFKMLELTRPDKEYILHYYPQLKFRHVLLSIAKFQFL